MSGALEATGRDASPAEQRQRLTRLLADVVTAREREAEQARVMPRAANAAALWEAQHATLQALLEYEAGIQALSWPVPRSMLEEIKMHRILCSRQHSLPTGPAARSISRPR